MDVNWVIYICGEGSGDLGTRIKFRAFNIKFSRMSQMSVIAEFCPAVEVRRHFFGGTPSRMTLYNMLMRCFGPLCHDLVQYLVHGTGLKVELALNKISTQNLGVAKKGPNPPHPTHGVRYTG